MVDPGESPVACWEFDGDILVLHHPTTISTKYQAMGEQRGGWSHAQEVGVAPLCVGEFAISYYLLCTHVQCGSTV